MSRYTVIANRGCKVIEGAVPVTEFVALTRAWSEHHEGDEWIVDALLAQALNANFVIGPKAACEAWRKELELDDAATLAITDALIERGKSANGGFNKAQLAILGVDWPPVKGWKNALLGTRVTRERAQAFLDARSGPPRPDPVPDGETPQAAPKNAPEARKTYVIVDQGNAIWCARCNKTSYNTNDIRNRYCPNCGFHE